MRDPTSGAVADSSGSDTERGGVGDTVQAVRGWQVLATSIALALLWMAIEVVGLLAGSPSLGVRATVARALEALPWQLILFGLVAGMVAIVVSLRRLRSMTWVLGLLLGVSSWGFLAVRLGEGMLRRFTAVQAVGAVALAAVGVAAVVAVLFASGRLLPRAVRPGWPWAATVGFSALFVPLLGRVGPALSRARSIDVHVSWTAPEIGFALAAALVAGALGVRPRIGSAAAATLVVLAAVLWPRPDPVQDAGSVASPAGLPNVILIVVDTMRSDHLAAHREGESLGPTLATVAAQGVQFLRAYSPSNRTLLAMPGVLTSMPWRVAGPRLSPGAVTIAEHLKRAGYTTIGLSANPLVSGRLGYDQGFDWFSDSHDRPAFHIDDLRRVAGFVLPGLSYRLGLVESGIFYRPFEQMRLRAQQLFAESARPVFLFLHTMELHGPYLPPPQFLPADYAPNDFLSYFAFLRAASDGPIDAGAMRPEIRNLEQRYAAEMRVTDAQLALLVEELRESGAWANSLIWIVSDHGESFGEGGHAGHGGTNMTSSVLQVPMVLKPPRSLGIAPGSVRAPVSTYDVLPTTLSLLGLPPATEAFGRDLAPQLRGEPAPPGRILVSEAQDQGKTMISCIEGPWKLDLRMNGRGSLEHRRLYHVVSDPGELRDLAAVRPRVARRLEAAVRSVSERVQGLALERVAPELDAATAEELRSLGYAY